MSKLSLMVPGDASNRIAAVGFDLDGTLIDTVKDLTAATNAMLAELHFEALPAELVRTFVGHGVEQLIARVLREIQGGAEPSLRLHESALGIFRSHYRDNGFTHSRVYPGIVSLLNTLHEANIPLACITNKESQLTEPLLKASGLRSFFALVLCADLPEERKPAPRMLQTACRRLDVEPSRFAYVGDSATDRTAAQAAGCRFFGVTHGYGLPIAAGQDATSGIGTLASAVQSLAARPVNPSRA